MKPDYVFIGLKGSSQFKIINLHTQAIELFGDAKVNKYRFLYKATSQATGQATSQATSRPTFLLTSNAPTETLVVRTESKLDNDQVRRLDQD